MNVAPIRELLTRVAWGDRQACWNEIERRDRELQTLLKEHDEPVAGLLLELAAKNERLLRAEEALQAIDLRPTMARDYVRRYFTDRAALSPKGQPE